ncbi:hypothetical protein AVEN_41801-1 [Araneus ventricosus]|uniref:DUF4817 domain-containing protein n=1 Tax=Araneus ventricosus TaxID=182803 RepID=A0A4Y2ACP9_ARAVE|nr:hypothetical protein AVEN_41801-1 [Araneus ventricosus]
MSPCTLRKMIQKFQTTRQFGILPDRGRMQIPSSSVEDVTAAVVEACSQTQHGSVSVQVVSRVLDIPYSTVRKILLRILNPPPLQNQACASIARRGLREITASGIQTCSVTGQRYRDVLRDFVIPQLQQCGCLQDIIFMQDGPPPHIDRRVKQLLRQYFTDVRVISRHFPTAWPPRSPVIIPCDFFSWGFLKYNIYGKRPASLPDPKDSIRRDVHDIPADSLRSAVENVVLRLEHIVEHEGGHIEQF